MHYWLATVRRRCPHGCPSTACGSMAAVLRRRPRWHTEPAPRQPRTLHGEGGGSTEACGVGDPVHDSCEAARGAAKPSTAIRSLLPRTRKGCGGCSRSRFWPGPRCTSMRRASASAQRIDSRSSDDNCAPPNVGRASSSQPRNSAVTSAISRDLTVFCSPRDKLSVSVEN